MFDKHILNMNRTTIISLAGGTTALVIFAWEHWGLKKEQKLLQAQAQDLLEDEDETKEQFPVLAKWRPSKVLIKGANTSKYYWSLGGYYCAQISSFYARLDLREFVVTMQDIGEPAFQLIASPMYLVKGYMNQAITYKRNYILIIIGSITLVVLGGVTINNRQAIMSMMPSTLPFQIPSLRNLR